MKLLLVQVPAFNPNDGGVQRITFNLGLYFTVVGHEVAYFSFQEDGHIKPGYGKLYHVSETGFDENYRNVNYLKEVVEEFKPDFIINQMPYQQELINAMEEFTSGNKSKVIACVHNSLFAFKSNVKDIVKREVPRPLNSWLASDFLKWLPLLHHKIKHRHTLKAILDAHHITLLYTPPNYDELVYFLKPNDLNGKYLDFMPNPVMKVCEQVPEKEKVILHVGRINVPQKRSDLLLDFWEEIHKQLPDWRFQIVGQGPYSDILAADLKKRGLPRVELLGYRKPEKYYRKASIFMMPSAYEGFPNTVIEAQSFGCPVVAFNSYAALGWIVNNDKDSLLIRPYDIKEMGDKCIELVKQENRLTKFQGSALINARRFSIEEIGEKWIYLLKRLQVGS